MSPTVLLPLLLVTSCLGPGLLLLRRARLSPPDRLVAAVAVSLFLLFLAAFSVFVLRLPLWCHWLPAATAAGMTVAAIPDLRALCRARPARAIAVEWLLLLAFFALLSLSIRNFSGGMWAGDWVEHYQRATFFLHRLPADFLFIDRYPLPARPPMANVLSAHFMALTADRFETHQFIFHFLNTLGLLPCYLLARTCAPRTYSPRLITGLLALSPVAFQNATFPWTKLFTALYVLLAVHFYLTAIRRRSPVRLTATAAAVAAGMLVHFSAGPYAVPIAAHALYTLARRRFPRPARTAIACVTAAALVLLPWVGWSLITYGRQTFSSNTTVADSAHLTPAANLAKIAFNLYHSLVPHLVSVPLAQFRTTFAQPTTYGMVRDYAFLAYQQSLPLMAGLAGVVAFVTHARRRPAFPHYRLPVTFFTLWFLPTTILLGIAVVGTRDRWGLGHICLVPLAVAATAIVASRAPTLPTIARVFLAVALATDAFLGVLLQHFCTTRTFRPIDPARSFAVFPTPDMMSRSALVNYVDKLRDHYTFLADHVPAPTFVLVASWLAAAFLLFSTLRHLAPRRRPLRRQSNFVPH